MPCWAAACARTHASCKEFHVTRCCFESGSGGLRDAVACKEPRKTCKEAHPREETVCWPTPRVYPTTPRRTCCGGQCTPAHRTSGWPGVEAIGAGCVASAHQHGAATGLSVCVHRNVFAQADVLDSYEEVYRHLDSLN